MSENKKATDTPLYYPRKMRTGWCVAHEVTAAGITIERYGIHCQTYAEAYRRAEVMNRKQQVEAEAGRAGTQVGETPFLYPLQAGSEGTRRTETKVPGARRSRAGFSVGTRQVGESGQGERAGETIASKIRSGRSWPMKYLLADVSGSCARAA